MTDLVTASAHQGFGHGKVILLGEHAVVYGEPALAAGIAAGVRAYLQPGTGWLRVPAGERNQRVIRVRDLR